MAENQPDYNELQKVFTELGVDFTTHDYGPRGICGHERFNNRLAGMEDKAQTAVGHSIDITGVHFYFDVEGKYIGLVTEGDDSYWEERKIKT